MEPFVKRFPPQQGEHETLMMQITEHAGVPDGKYMVIDTYCTEPTCESCHLTLVVVRVEPPTKIPMAILNYEWDPTAPTWFDLQVDEESTAQAHATHGPAFQEIITNHLRVAPAYGETLKSHFKQFRASIAHSGGTMTGNRAQRRARR